MGRTDQVDVRSNPRAHGMATELRRCPVVVMPTGSYNRWMTIDGSPRGPHTGSVRWSDEHRRTRLIHRLLSASVDGGHDRPETVADVARRLVGLHASDPATVYLTAAARLPHLAVDQIFDQLHDGSTVRHHAMRRTLWVFDPDTAALAHASSTRKFGTAEHRRFITFLDRLNDEPDRERPDGVDWPDEPEEWIERAKSAVLEQLADGPLSTRELGQRLPHFRVMLDLAPGKNYSATVSALNRILMLMGFDATITRMEPAGGSWINSQYKWLRTDQLSDLVIDRPDLDAGPARRLLALRYLESYGPATEVDVRWWTGWTATSTRGALEAAVAVGLDHGDGYVHPGHVDPPIGSVEPCVALLPALDPATMGWKQRDWYLNPALTSKLFDSNGNGGPTIWIDGRIVGGWVQRPDGDIAWRLLDDDGDDRTPAIEHEVIRLREILGDSRFKVRFPTPLIKELLS